MRIPRVSPFPRASSLLACLAVWTVLAWPGSVSAQAGSVGGTVVDAVSRQPLSGAQITVEGTQRGSLSDARGRFLINQVSAGAHNLRVTYIGYGTQTKAVTVTVGATATVAFELQISAVALDEVVVTGTAGSVEKRKVGSSMASMNVEQVRESVPIADFGTALQARIPGVRSIGVVGGVGAGRSLQIRGNNSFNLDQRPVVYIDGVRVNTYQNEWATGATGTVGSKAACCSFSGGAGEDRLSDLNPEDIERIEVLKGAAAATLYGSEASNGVIQIFTKRGRSNSRPVFTMNMNYGINRLRENIQTTLYPKFKGPQGFQAWDANEHLVESGGIRGVDLSAQGGGEDVTYFVAGAYNYEQGSVTPNWQKRGNLRMNLRWVASNEWTFAINTAYSRNRILSLQSGNNWMSLLGNAVLGNPRKATADAPYGEPWIPVANIKKVDTFDDANRFTAGTTATYQPFSWFTNKWTVGMDVVDEEKSRMMPFGYFYTYVGTVGERNLGYRRASTWTTDYLGTMNFTLRDDLTTELSFGAQGFWEKASNQLATGRTFAGPGVTVVSGGATTFGEESFVETINVGMFAQDRISFKDKLFATVGWRVDGNSAFGENYGLKSYPKVDLAYQISREGFLPSVISNLKLRGAVGQAGKFPGAFDQFQTYNAESVLADVAGVTPYNPGNADLKPETTTEIEVGFDAGLFEDRVGLTFTYYRAKTKDALLSVNQPPSLGFPQARLENAGVIENKGWEASLNVTPINTSALRWSVDVNVDGNSNKILDLGSQAVWQKVYKWSGGDFRTGGTYVTDSVKTLGGHYLGYPIRSQWNREILSWDPVKKVHTRGTLYSYVGPPLPTFNGSLANTFTFGAFRLYGLVSIQRGAVFNNGDRPFRVRQGAGDEYLGLFDFNKLDAQGNPTPTAAADSLLNYFTLYTPYEKRDHIRLREVSVSCTLPTSISDKAGLGRTTLTLSGQNLMWWDDCHCMDPDMNYLGGNTVSNQSGFLAMPQSRRFLFSIRTSFGG